MSATAAGGRGILVEGAEQIATLAGGAGPRRGPAQGEIAGFSARSDGPLALACLDGRIVAAGPRPEVLRAIDAAGATPDDLVTLDASGAVVTPGLVDAHTHLLFGGTREAEWQLRARGAGYLEILAAGGGILSTVAATRAASDETLLAGGRGRLDQMLAAGTTTVEAKSGYGLDTASELRLIGLADRLGRRLRPRIVPTFLGAHAVPADLRTRPDGVDAYVEQVVGEQLPAVAAQGIATSCDVFCEEGVFNAERSRRILGAARSLGLAVRLHADELGPSGGAELAAELALSGGCLSADHLSAVTEAGIVALAKAAEAGSPVVATLLPATSWFLMRHHFAPARAFVEARVPVALATDLNPGTSPTLSLPLVMSVACLEMGLTPAEALVAVTINAAHGLGLGAEIGSLEPGKQADFVVWDVPALDQLPYWLGARLARTVVIGGEVAFER